MVSLLYVLWCCAVLVTIATPSLQAKHDITVSSQISMPEHISLEASQWTEKVSGPVSYQDKLNLPVRHHLMKRQIRSNPFLLFGNERFIEFLDLDGSHASLQAIYNDSAARVVGIDFDYRNRYIFWSDNLRQSLRISDFNGLGIRTLISSRTTSPWDVAWDWINNKLYWTDYAEQEIEVYDFANGYRRVLLYTGNTSAPLGIVVDPQNRWLYWTDTSIINPKIERASMDGTSRTTLHSTSLIFPSGITLDYTSQTLYWIDAARFRIESSGVDGSNRRTVTTVNANNPWGIVYYSGNLYWTDRISGRSLIYASSARFPSPRNLLSGFTLTYFPLGIEVVSSSRQLQSTNPCGSSNGGCSYICLLSSQASIRYSCACPDDRVLASNGVTCSTPSSGQLRLVQGNYTTSTLTSGRLEIYLNGQWGTVCDDLWGQVEANVACRQLGYTSAVGYGRSIHEGFAVGRGRIWLDDVVCSSSSSSILSCSHSSIGVHNCIHDEDVALHCSRCTSSQFRCDNGQCVPSSYRCNGRTGGCSDGSDERGCTCTSSQFRCDNGQCVSFSVRCNGIVGGCSDGSDERGCPVTPGDLRLARGTRTSTSYTYGRLEIYISGQWGTVCDDFWDSANSDVACRQLGYSGAARPTSYRASISAGFGTGTGPIWLDDVHCQGFESRLTSCSNRGIGSHNCGHFEDVAIYCSGAATGISVTVILTAVLIHCGMLLLLLQP